MDSITQAVLGAAVQGVGMGKYQGRKALIYGALLGTLPDLDVFIRYNDPISSMTYHRGFSHSIFVLTAFAFLITWLTFKRQPKLPYAFKRLFITLTLALVTHPLIDAMTVYGTQLFWPLDFTPLMWSTVFIIDPIYTLPLIIACLWAWLKRVNSTTRRYMCYALLFGVLYFAWGFAGRYYHEQRVSHYLAQQGIQVEKILATPTPFNTLLWRVIAIDNQNNLYDTMSGWFDKRKPDVIITPLNTNLKNQIIDLSPLLQRLDWFTNGWLSYQEIDNQLIVSDTRMGLAGEFNFRFIIAQQDQQGWHSITPQSYPTMKTHQQLAMLKPLWDRMWSDNQPFPSKTH